MAGKKHVDIFYEKLKNLSNNGMFPVSNKTLMSELCWEKKKYDRIKNELIEDGKIKIGSGHSGTVNIIKDESDTLVKIFVSYSHADSELQKDLVKHLLPLQNSKLASIWHDGIIDGGKEWAQEIMQNLKSAHIVILLISIDFINSYYCQEVELKNALLRHEDGKTRVIPVIARTCLWQEESFAKLQALLKGKAVGAHSDRDEALTEVAKNIKQLVLEMRETF
jgi:hypothetical protein